MQSRRISIHLMFLLIQRWELYRHSKGGYFNTSHVSINHTGSIATTCVVRDFNTSHVSINLIHILPFWNAYRISIHLMFLLIAAAAPSDNTTTVISIHLMFLLIRYPIRSRWIRNIYFNTSHVSINPTLLSAFPFLLYLKFLENTSFFKFFPSVSQT